VNIKRIALGAAVGVLLGATAIIVGRVRSGAFVSASCPRGWTAQLPTSTSGEAARLVCTVGEGANATGRMELLWVPGGELSDGALLRAARAAGWSSVSDLAIDRAGEPGHQGASVSREHAGAPMKSDVYFLSAGQRYGLLSIVYGPAATFVAEDSVAAWMETVRGTAPWGAPVSPELAASCPAQFTTIRAAGRGLVLRCIRDVGTSAFTVLQLTQSEGGFGSEQDRARLAGDIAQRVASSSGARARVLIEPTPFTRARNVDAMHARFETDERVTLYSKVAWMRASSSGNVIALYAGADTDEGLGAARGLLSNVRASRVSDGMLAGIAAVMVLAGGVAGALSSRRKPAPAAANDSHAA